MANIIFATLCLLSVCSLPCGDAANLSRQGPQLDVRQCRTVEQRSAGNHARLARSVLAARVVDEHGNTVHLHSTGHANSRRVVHPFVTSQSQVTSHSRQQQTRTSGGRRLNYRRPVTQPRVVSTTPVLKTGRRHSRSSVLRQSLPGSNGFATYYGQRFDIRPHQGVVPHSQQTRTNQHGRHTAPANQRSRQTVLANRRSQEIVSANHGPRRTLSGGRSFDRSRHTVVSYNDVNVQPTRQQFRTQQSSRPNVISQQSSRPNAISPQSSRPDANFQQSSRPNAIGSRPSLSLPVPDIGLSVYEQGLEPHTPFNAQRMRLFGVRFSDEPQFYLDPTKNTGTVFTSHTGQCPVMSQSRCGPLPNRPLPPSCGNDYQCHGQRSKCCYDPCLAMTRCVQPVQG